MASESILSLGMASPVLEPAFDKVAAQPATGGTAASKAQAFQEAMRRTEGNAPKVAEAGLDKRAALSAQHSTQAASPVLDAFVESIKNRDQKLRAVFTGDPSRPETAVEALNFMQRHQTAILEFHAVLQVAENLKNGINKLTNMQ